MASTKSVASALLAFVDLSDTERIVNYTMLEAGVMQLAPSGHILPCRSPPCVWRWAARELLGECGKANAELRAARAAFIEELGDSTLQRFLDLQEMYYAQEEKLRETVAELDQVRGRMEKLERQCTEAMTSRDQAAAAQEHAEWTCAQHETTIVQLREDVNSFHAEIDRLSSESISLAWEQRCQQIEARFQQSSLVQSEEKAALSGELSRSKAELAARVKEIEALEGTIAKLRREVRKANRALRPWAPAPGMAKSYA